jgi:energy-coupling factor transport system ATP-binding protein
LNTVRKINVELGTTVIISEHRLEDIFPYADRAVVMDGGRIVAEGAPREVGKSLYGSNDPMFCATPAPMRAYFSSGGTDNCPLTVRDGAAWLGDLFPGGATVRRLPQRERVSTGNVALSAKELWFRYEKDSPDVLRGTSIEVPEGSFTALVGGNGAGKSTFLGTVCGALRAYRGKIELFGKRIEKYKHGELYRGCVSMLPQDVRSLFVKKSVRQELEEMSSDEAKINDVASFCGIVELYDRHPYDLSCGEAQRTALAKVLLTYPRILLLDEPTKGMDSVFKGSFGGLLRSLTARGITILAVSHDVEFCAEYADCVGMFFDGGVLTLNTPEGFFGGNSFYTTSASRMSRAVFDDAVTVGDVVSLVGANKGTKS